MKEDLDIDFSIIIGGLVIVILSGIFYNNIDAIVSIVNFGSLFTYLFVHLSSFETT